MCVDTVAEINSGMMSMTSPNSQSRDEQKVDICQHLVAFNSEGMPVVVKGKMLWFLRFRPMSTEEWDKRVDTILDGYENSPHKRLVVYVHGGLNSLTGAYRRAERLVLEMPEVCYPLFLIWPSSLLSSWLDHIFFIRQGMRSPVAGPLTSPLHLIADLFRAVSRLPIVFLRLLSSALQSAVPSWGLHSAARRALKLAASGEGSGGNGIQLGMKADTRTSSEKLLSLALYLATLPAKLVLAALIDAGGKAAWQVMRRRTKMLFDPTSGIDSPDYSDVVRPPALPHLITALVTAHATGRFKIAASAMSTMSTVVSVWNSPCPPEPLSGTGMSSSPTQEVRGS